MKIPSLASAFILFLGFASAALAQTPAIGLKQKGEFTLKDGTVLVGEVIRMQGQAYVIEYQRSAAVKDLKIVPIGDVVKIITEKPDEKAFVEIAKLLPTPDLLTVDDYKARIATVKAFITKYPKSAKLPDAELVLKTLTAENAEVAAGGRKLRGIMIKAADYRANAFEFDARVLEAKIRAAAKNAQWLTALRAFADMDKDYQSTACYSDVKPVVVNALQEVRKQVSASLATYEARMAKRDADLQGKGQAEREATQRALDAEAARLEKIYQSEKDSQQAWVTWNPDHTASMEDDKSMAESELQRLAAPQPVVPDGGRIFRNAWKVVHSQANAEAMEKAVADAEAAGLPERYVKMLQDAVTASGVKPGEDK